MRKPLFFKIFMAFIILAVFLSSSIIFFSLRIIKDHYMELLASNLENISFALEAKVIPYIIEKDFEGLDEFIKDTAGNLDARVTIIAPDGRVLADSQELPQAMENHKGKDRPEILMALEGRKGKSIRYSTTVEEEMLYVAVPIEQDGRILGALRSSLYLTTINSLFNELIFRIDSIALLIILIFIIAGLIISKTITRPLRQLSQASQQMARGDFTSRVYLKGQNELKDLADNFNYMSENMNRLFKELSGQKAQLNNIIASIPEGLMVIDEKGRMLLFNESFRKIIGHEAIKGKFYWEIIREPGFDELVKEVNQSKGHSMEILNLRGKIFLCSATYLKDAGELVIVFHDITEMKKLEKIKRDFVINVSHELRTPLTAIKGFTETLEDETSKDSSHYVDIIKRHTDRLINIVNDLLILSNIEDERSRLELSKVDIVKMLDDIVSMFEQTVKTKGLKIRIKKEGRIKQVTADAFKLEQVFINLINNAVKYTEEGAIEINLQHKNDDLVVQVKDTGIGIPPEHLSRIFERFYVVDKSRSKSLGGTGLGLAIVKHILLLHGGDIKVESTPGEGSVFTVFLPTEQS